MPDPQKFEPAKNFTSLKQRKLIPVRILRKCFEKRIWGKNIFLQQWLKKSVENVKDKSSRKKQEMKREGKQILRLPMPVQSLSKGKLGRQRQQGIAFSLGDDKDASSKDAPAGGQRWWRKKFGKLVCESKEDWNYNIQNQNQYLRLSWFLED